ncbi:MAG: metallophosphoesterase [bacterium]|nr:metallophosphoesterase [bacterium]
MAPDSPAPPPDAALAEASAQAKAAAKAEVVPAARQAGASADGGLTLVHFGDLHVWRWGWDGDFYIKRAFGLANLVLRRARAFPPGVAGAVAARLVTEQADYAVFSGDLSTTSLRREFEAGRELLEPLLDRWRERFIAIPGNHDRYTPRAAEGRLFERLGLPAAGENPFVTDLDGGWTLVGIDLSTPRPFSARGRFGPDLLARVGDLLSAQRARGRRLAVMGHYPLVYPACVPTAWSHGLAGRAELRQALERTGVAVYLHGHKHYRWRVDRGGVVYLNCGSAGMAGHDRARRPGYVKLRLGPDGLVAATAYWLTEAWQPGEPPDWRSAELAPQGCA